MITYNRNIQYTVNGAETIVADEAATEIVREVKLTEKSVTRRNSPVWVLNQRYDGSRFTFVKNPTRGVQKIANDETGEVRVIMPNTNQNRLQLGRALAEIAHWQVQNVNMADNTVILKSATGQLRRVNMTTYRVENMIRTRYELSNGGRSYRDNWEVNNIVSRCIATGRKGYMNVNKYVILAWMLNPVVKLEVATDVFKSAAEDVVVGFRLELARICGHEDRDYVTARMPKYNARMDKLHGRD